MTINLLTILEGWQLRPLVLLVWLTAVFLYWRGRRAEPIPHEQDHPYLFYGSMLVLAVALLSPLHELATQLFAARVLQHLLLISLFAMLLMRSNGLPVLARGLPWGWGARLAANEPLRARVRQFTPKGVVWFLFVATVWLWYDPALHMMATVTRPWLRPLELTTLLIAACLHWWHVAQAEPHLHPKLPLFPHIGYTMLGALPLKVPGLLLMFSVAVAYNYPTVEFFGYTLNPLSQQQLGGALIWLFGGFVYTFNGLSRLGDWLEQEEAKPPQPRTLWDNEESMLAPGVSGRNRRSR